MSDPTNDVLQDLRNCMKNEPPPYFIELLRRAADEIERLLRGDFTDAELINMADGWSANFERILNWISGDNQSGERTT